MLKDVSKELRFPSLKSKQTDAIVAFVLSNDTLVSLPTAVHGKSMIFAMVPLVFDKLLGYSALFYKYNKESHFKTSTRNVDLIDASFNRDLKVPCTFKPIVTHPTLGGSVNKLCCVSCPDPNSAGTYFASDKALRIS